MGLATTTSRILGMFRDSLNASLFGADVVSDAFWVAFRIPNLLRELLAEGALSSAFIPAFSRVRHEGGEEAAWRLAGLMANAMLIVMAAVVLLGEVFSPALIRLLAPGFQYHAGQLELAVRLNRLLFPFVACMAFGALFTGVLNARRHFLLPALAPAITNLCMILAGYLLCPLFGVAPERQVYGWALGALAGGFLQFAVHVPPVVEGGFKPFWAWPFGDKEVRKVFLQMAPAIFALSITQINLLVNQGLASLLPPGSQTILLYGNRLMQLPMGIFGVAIATATLPNLSDSMARRAPDEFKETLAFGMRLSLFITVAAMTGLIVLAEPINQLLFHWGRFTALDAHRVALASICYAPMVVSASLVKLYVPAFYALGDSSRPVKVGLWTILLNLAFNLLFLKFLPQARGYLGIALSSTLVSLCYASSLLWLLRRKLGSLGARAILKDFFKSCLAAAGMAVLILTAQRALLSALPALASPSRPRLAIEVGLLLAMGAGSYFLFSRWLGLKEWEEWFKVRRGSSTPPAA
jgi:putative peptidoglycan lipid II flippase